MKNLLWRCGGDGDGVMLMVEMMVLVRCQWFDVDGDGVGAISMV